MWILFLIVVHNSVPTDIPGKIALELSKLTDLQNTLRMNMLAKRSKNKYIGKYNYQYRIFYDKRFWPLDYYF